MRDPKTGRFPKGNGAGWGGPAKGASTSRIKPGDPDGIRTMNRGKEVQAERREKVLRMYEEIVDDPEQPVMARITAGDKLLDRIDGKPMQTNLNLNRDDVSRLSDAELEAEIARLEREAAGAAAGEAKPGDPVEPGGVVH